MTTQCLHVFDNGSDSCRFCGTPKEPQHPKDARSVEDRLREELYLVRQVLDLERVEYKACLRTQTDLNKQVGELSGLLEEVRAVSSVWEQSALRAHDELRDKSQELYGLQQKLNLAHDAYESLASGSG